MNDISKPSLSKPLVLEDRVVILVDTQGLDNKGKTDIDILRDTESFLTKSWAIQPTTPKLPKLIHYSYKKNQIIGVIYLHDIKKVRMGNTAAPDVETFQNCFGQWAAKNIVILTTQWDLVTDDIGVQRFEELKTSEHFFKDLVAHGATMEKSRKGDNYDHIIKSIVDRTTEKFILWVLYYAGGLYTKTVTG